MGVKCKATMKTDNILFLLLQLLPQLYNFPQIGKSSEAGCLNSCCAVCIPEKNCDVCYKLNRSDPDNCPCIDSLSTNQKESLLQFQKYFIEKFQKKSEEDKQEAVWKPYITSKSGNKIY